MIPQPELSDDRRSVTVHVPLKLHRRGGRKRVLAPPGAAATLPRPERIDNTLVKAIARAHRWQGMLETGPYASVEELATAERINPSYLARVLRLTLLAPGLLETVLAGNRRRSRSTSSWAVSRYNGSSSASSPPCRRSTLRHKRKLGHRAESGPSDLRPISAPEVCLPGSAAIRQAKCLLSNWPVAVAGVLASHSPLWKLADVGGAGF